MRILILLVFSFSLAGFTADLTGQSWQNKVSPSLLKKARDGQPVSFLILLPQQADVSAAHRLDTKDEKASFVFQMLRNTASETQARLITFLEEKGAPHESLFIINAVKTEGNLELIHTIALRSDVSMVLDNSAIRFAQPVEWVKDDSNSRSVIEWGLDMINADDVWAMGFRGQGVIVGGEDTGYDWTHPSLKKQYRGYDSELDTADHNYNWHDAIHEISPLNFDSLNPCGLDVKEPCDDHGHGTHTMGTMIGEDGDNQIGVAPEAQWCACRNMERGWGSPFTYLECFQWFLAPTDLNNANPDPTKAPHVINNSWGCPQVEGCDSSNWEILNIAVNNLRLAGTVVVVSAGNSGRECSTVSTPAAIYDGSFSVGATAENDTIAGFSSRGPVLVDGSNRLKPNISAPGVRVRSARPGGDYGISSGTSMAAPHVAGVVALLISANPELAGKVDIIENIIEQTAAPKTTDQMCGDIPGTMVPNHTYGFGRIDALTAVQAAIALIPVKVDDNHTLEGVRVYPNPVLDQLFISSTQAHTDMTIEMIDARGKMIFHCLWRETGLMKLDFSDRPSGIYFYRIMADGQMQVGKVVKQ